MLREIGYKDSEENEAVTRMSCQFSRDLVDLHGQGQVEVARRLELLASTTN